MLESLCTKHDGTNISILVPFINGTISTCFLDLILYGIVSIFSLTTSLLRALQLRRLKVEQEQEFIYSKSFLLKIFLVPVLAVLPVARTIAHIFEHDTIISELIAGLHVPLTWITCLCILLWEHKKGTKSNWPMRIFFISSFLLSSLNLQSNISISKTSGFGVDFYIAVINFVLQIAMVILGLFYNSKPNKQKRLWVHSLREEESVSLISNGENPEEEVQRKVLPVVNASWFSRVIWYWVTPLVRLGYKKPLEANDLYLLPEDTQTAQLAKTFEESWNKEKKKKKPYLLRATFNAFGRQWLFSGVMKLFADICQLIGPIMLRNLIIFVKDPNEPMYMGLLYTLGLFLSNISQSLFTHHWYYNGLYVGMKSRAAVGSAIYQKSFKLSAEGRRGTTVGELVNLQAIDGNRLQELCSHLHVLWAAPLQLIVCIAMLWQLLGAAILAGVACSLVFAPFSWWLTKKLLRLQREVMEVRDNRTKLMNEILNGIRIIKFFTWETPFSDNVMQVRSQEVKKQNLIYLLNSCVTLCWAITPLSISVVAFTVFASRKDAELSPQLVFTALALFNVLRMPLMMIPSISGYLIEFTTSLGRIQRYLLLKELDSDQVIYGDPRDSKYSVEINEATFDWNSGNSTSQLSLDKINLKIQKGELIIVVGTVGSGKTSLLSALLGYIPKISGQVKMNGKTAYVAQSAWIQNTTLRENIIFGSSFDAEKYERVLKACELTKDLEILPNGDKTEIGEKGINLSGGQKQRVSLARAAYQFETSDIFLFDDCLSAVDAHVGKNIFSHCISELLAGKTRILCTHQLQFASRADRIVVLDEGKISEIGTYEELMERKMKFFELITTFVQETKEIKESTSEKPSDDKKTELTHKKERYLGSTNYINFTSNGKLMTIEDREVGNVSGQIWTEYIKAAGGVAILIFAALFYTSESGTKLGIDFWLSKWSSAYTDGPISRSELSLYIGVYAALSIASVVSAMLRTLTVSLAALKASKTLHLRALNKVFRAKMSYFDTTPIGRILNRFSNDLYKLDANVAGPMVEFIWNIFLGLSVMFVIGLTTPFLIVMFLPLSHFGGNLLTPIFSLIIGETLNGVATITAFRRQSDFTKINDKKLDFNLEAWWSLIITNRWLSLRMESMATCVVAAVALFVSIARKNMSPSLVGIAILYSMQLSTVMTWLIRWATEVESQMVSVERIVMFSKIESEAPYEIPESSPEEKWPRNGLVKLNNIKLKYRPDLDFVLKGVTIEIKPREKVGVVGRTGAGKSSLMLALFRLVELSEGSIIIDGIDISKIGLKDLRSKLSIIPQEPTLFTGTIRSNLDPFNIHSDDEVWKVLERVYLKDAVENMQDKLSTKVIESGSNLSSGQQQLICLGRALMKKSTILLMDEATAAVDFETDSLIQETIRKEFANVTVITIAHRINTIMDYDKVLVLEQGQVAEFDSPQRLLENPSSLFASLASKSGTQVNKEKWT